MRVRKFNASARPGFGAARLAASLLSLALCLTAAAPSRAQTAEADAPDSPIVVVSLDKIRAESLAAKSIEQQTAKIRDELRNRFEERRQALAAEEKALVALRATMEPDAFEARAARFEQQVRELKKDRRDQSLALRHSLRIANEQMDRVLQPILAELMAERRAVIMIDNRDVVIGAVSLDVTQAAINRLDAKLPRLEVQWPMEQKE